MSAKTRAKPARERARLARRRALRRRGRIYAIGAASVAVLFAALAVFLISKGGSSQPTAGAEASGSYEPQVSIGSGTIQQGKPFPAFSVASVDSGVVTKDSLGGKPTIIWFTTSYCLPCQLGAQEVAKFDDQLGGNAFNVLVMFVDPSDRPSALLSWREKFARPDWIIALDQNDTFARAVNLLALDTKFLLDAQGRLVDVNTVQADSAYLALLQKVTRGEP